MSAPVVSGWLPVVCVAICIVFSLSGCRLCGNTPISEVISPGGMAKAVVFVRSCGATTDFSTHVSVLPAGQKLSNEGGNVFVADSDHGRAPTGPKGQLDVRLRWTAENHLTILFPPGSRVFRSETRVGPLQIDYNSVLRAAASRSVCPRTLRSIFFGP